jgi:hypothetical protein
MFYIYYYHENKVKFDLLIRNQLKKFNVDGKPSINIFKLAILRDFLLGTT